MKPVRPIEKKASLAAVSGAVIIQTATGSIVVTPDLARILARDLPGLAYLATSIQTPIERLSKQSFDLTVLDKIGFNPTSNKIQ